MTHDPHYVPHMKESCAIWPITCDFYDPWLPWPLTHDPSMWVTHRYHMTHHSFTCVYDPHDPWLMTHSCGSHTKESCATSSITLSRVCIYHIWIGHESWVNGHWKHMQSRCVVANRFELQVWLFHDKHAQINCPLALTLTVGAATQNTCKAGV